MLYHSYLKKAGINSNKFILELNGGLEIQQQQAALLLR